MLGLVFLYVPIISMIVFSFNNSRLVTVWDAAHSPTLKWYGALVHNEQILRRRVALDPHRADRREPLRWCSARWPAWRWRASAPSAGGCCSPA